MPAIDERLDRDADAWRSQVDQRFDALALAVPAADRPARTRRTVAVVAAAGGVSVVALAVSLFAGRTTSSEPVVGRSTTPTIASSTVDSPSPTESDAALPDRPGYERVYLADVPGHEAYAKARDLDWLAPPSPHIAVLWQYNRGDTALLIPVYDKDDNVIGSFKEGDVLSVNLDCAGNRGYAFALKMPMRHGAASSPIAAARSVHARYGLVGYDAPASSWRVTGSQPGRATVVSGVITLRAVQWPDGTWVVTSGQRCSA